jgi:hypothetical protein
MNSIIDLNTSSLVTFNQQSSYAIVIGNSLGNTTAVTDQGYDHTAQQRVPITSITNAVRDILVDFVANTTGSIANVSYQGPFGNIGIQKIATNTWRAFGVRDVTRYNELFANTLVRDAGISNAYSYTTSLNDQFGNTRIYSTAVTVTAPPAFTITGNVVYDEGVVTPVTQISVTGNAVNSYKLVSSIGNAAVGQIGNSVTSGTTTTITGNIAVLNAAIANDVILYYPGTDLASNVANAIQVQLRRSNDNHLIQSANMNLDIGNTNPEFALTPYWDFDEDVGGGIAATVTDNDPVNTTYRVRYQQVTPDPAVYGNAGIIFNGVTSGSTGRTGDTGNIVATRTQLNNFLPNNNAFQYAPPIDYVGNVVINYTQEKLVAGSFVMQANAVPIEIELLPHDEYSDPNGSFTGLEGSIIRISDTAANVNTGLVQDRAYVGSLDVNGAVNSNPVFTQTWTQVSPDPAVYQPRWFNSTTANVTPPDSGWSARGANSVSRTGLGPGSTSFPDTEINAVAIRYTPPLNYSGNIVLRFDQTKVQEGNTYTQASNVQFTMNVSGNTTVFTCNPPTTGLIFTPIRFSNISLTDNDTLAERQYRLDLSVTAGNANIFFNNTNVGNTANIVGNASQITSQISNASSYLEGSASNVGVTYQVTRTVPDNTVIATETRNLTLAEPNAGDFWRGGVFVGEYDPVGDATANVYLTIQTGASVVDDNYFVWWGANGVSNTTPTNSTRNGETNTANLVSSNAALYTAASFTDSFVSNGFSDWHLGSEQEMLFVANVKHTLNVGNISVVFSGSDPNPNKFWTSTVSDQDFAGNIRRAVSQVNWGSGGNISIGYLTIEDTDPESGNTARAYQTAVRWDNK